MQKQVKAISLGVLCALSSLTSSITYGQTAEANTISITVKADKLGNTIKQIESETDYTFAYDPKVLNLEKNLHFSNDIKSLKAFLKVLETSYGIDSNIVGKTVYLKVQTDKENGAQTRNSSLRGIILDEVGALPGAAIKVLGANVGTVSRLDGSFSLVNLPSGKQTVQITFIGMAEQQLEVNLESGQTYNMGMVTMKPDDTELEEVVVKGSYYPSQVRALNIKKNFDGIAEVLAADAIGKLPDRNAAEAVQRLQGVSIERDLGEGRFVSVRGTPIQWSATLMNGNRLPSASGDNANRGVQMDIFPSELIEYVQLSKALTPDIDGDAIGGSMNFITKAAPYDKAFNINLGATYSEQAQEPGYNASIVYGDRIGKKFGFMMSAVVWDRNTGTDQYRLGYNFENPDAVQAYSINNIQLRDYLARRQTMGYNLGLEYEFNPDHKVYFKGMYSRYLDQQSVREVYFNIDQHNTQLQARHTDYVTDLYSMQLSGKSKLSEKLHMDWQLQTARSSFAFDAPKNLPKEERGYPIVNFIQQTDFDNLSSDGFKYLEMDSPNGIGDQIDAVLPYLTSTLDPNQMVMQYAILAQSENDETDYKGQVDFKYEASDRLKLKAGAKVSDKTKNVFSATVIKMAGGLLGIPNMPAPPMLNNMERESFPHNGGFLSEIGGIYNDMLIDQLTNDQIDQIYTDEFAQQYGLITAQGKDAPSNQTGSYVGDEQVYAAYLMGNYKLSGKVELIGGIRNEYNVLQFKGAKVSTNAAGETTVEDIVENNEYNAFLPMLHLKYKMDEQNLLRLAVTRTYAKADFSQLNPGVTISDIARTVVKGNTDLKPTFSINYDLMFEHYFNEVGLISGGAFYKQLSNFIYDNQSIAVVNGENYLLSRPENLDKAWLYGFEFGLSRRFRELPGFLKNFGIEGNYTFVDSEVKIPEFKDGEQVGEYSSSLPKQAKHIFNAVLFYEDNAFTARIAGNFKGKYVNTIRSVAGPEHYEWFDDNFTVDFSTSYAFTEKMRVFAEVNNITNTPNRMYHGTVDRPERASWFGVRGQVGLSYNFR
ncbi:TonB-dependent receptor [Limibacter armeniacum]|uniref:TonB-dependent receptor n=1 Tax=Limibacter armeniacum TaxID=466084 RepID=UPI002FE554A7